MPDRPDQLRIAIVLSGGASLGAYQAGAVAALLAGVQRVQQEDPDAVVVDAVGGASAGALVAFFGSHALLDGLDSAELLREAWVERVSLDLLRGGGRGAPLAFDDLRERIREFLSRDEPVRRVGAPQRHPLALHVALTGLQGLTYPIRELRKDESFVATTYADWGRFVLEGGRGAGQLLEPDGAAPLDFVLASASHPGAFRPRLLDRSDEADEYRQHGIDGFPASGKLWYTDGGLVQGKPVGRVLAAARHADEAAGRDGDYRRVLVLVDPRSEGPSGSQAWADPDGDPGWLEALGRALAVLPAQVIYDDVRRAEKRNSKLRWAEELVEALAPRLDADGRRAVRSFLERLEADRERLPAEETQRRGLPDEDDAAGLLRRAVGEIGGLVSKEPVDVNVVSPLLLGEDGEAVPALLAGEFMGDFGGFLEREIRESDFRLGYASAEAWLDGGLADTGFDREKLAAMREEAAARSPGHWREANVGDIEPGDLSWRTRAGLGRLALDAFRAVGRELLRR